MFDKVLLFLLVTCFINCSSNICTHIVGHQHTSWCGEALPVFFHCISNTVRGRPADSWLLTGCNNKQGTEEEAADPAPLSSLTGNPSQWWERLTFPDLCGWHRIHRGESGSTLSAHQLMLCIVSQRLVGNREEQTAEPKTKLSSLLNEVQPSEPKHHSSNSSSQAGCVSGFESTLHVCFFFVLFPSYRLQEPKRSVRLQEDWLVLTLEPISYI